MGKKDKIITKHARPDLPKEELAKADATRVLVKSKSDIAFDFFLKQNKENTKNARLRYLEKHDDFFREFACEIFTKGMNFAYCGEVLTTDAEVDELIRRQKK